jgi:Xaa-Pro aminopeptidase
MFQTFSDTSAKHLTPERIARLRAELKRLGVDGFIVPRADEFQGEYVPPHAERLGWLTGFSGSAGEAVILAGNAAIFVDGRYTLQVREQVDPALSRRSRYRRTSRGPGRPKTCHAVANWLMTPGWSR